MTKIIGMLTKLAELSKLFRRKNFRKMSFLNQKIWAVKKIIRRACAKLKQFGALNVEMKDLHCDMYHQSSISMKMAWLSNTFGRVNKARLSRVVLHRSPANGFLSTTKIRFIFVF